MIIVFGAVLLSIRMGLRDIPPVPETYFAGEYDIGIGGRAAICALGAVKCEAKTALVGCIGDDHYGKNILLRLRQNEIITSGVARAENLDTGSIVETGGHPHQYMIALGASEQASHEQIPEDILNASTVLLLHDEFPAAQNVPLLPKAKNCGSKVILSMGRRNDLSEYDLDFVDYVIAEESNSAVIGRLIKAFPHKLVVFKDKAGAEARDEKGGPVELPPPEIEGLAWIDPLCAYEAFCGAFAAGLEQARGVRASLLRASVTAALTGGKDGGYRTLPYPDEIREGLSALQSQ